MGKFGNIFVYLRSSSFLDSRWYAVMRRRTRPFNSDGAGNGSSPLPAAESSSLPDGLTEGARDSDGVFELEPRLPKRGGGLHWTSYETDADAHGTESLMRKQPGSAAAHPSRYAAHRYTQCLSQPLSRWANHAMPSKQTASRSL